LRRLNIQTAKADFGNDTGLKPRSYRSACLNAPGHEWHGLRKDEGQGAVTPTPFPPEPQGPALCAERIHPRADFPHTALPQISPSGREQSVDPGCRVSGGHLGTADPGREEGRW